MSLGLEEVPRPVVAFVLGGCRLKPREALIECLRELADEGVVRYETDATGMPVIGLGADSPRSGRPLLRFEQVALARVRTRAGRQARVPFSALVSDDGDGYKNWAKEQQEELGQEARQAGLAVKSPPPGSWQAVLSLAAVAVGTVVSVHAVDWKAGDTMAGPVLWAAFLVLFVPLFLRKWRLTPEGTAAVGARRRAARAMARTARGLGTDSGRTVWQLDGPGGAALPKGHAWSSLGGQWHTVQLGQELSRPVLSTLPGLGMLLLWTFMGSFFAVLIGGVVFGFGPDGTVIAVTPAALGAVVTAGLWRPAYTRRMALPDDVTFTGEVVKLQYVDGGSDSPDEYLVWVDEGSPVSMKFDVAPAMYHRLSVSDLVLVNWSPRRGRLNDIAPAGRVNRQATPRTAVLDASA